MGYDMKFRGQLQLSRALTKAQADYLEALCLSRRMARDVKALAKVEDPIRKAAGLPLGDEGMFFIGQPGNDCADTTALLRGYNSAPQLTPGYWCPWGPTADRKGLWIPEEGRNPQHLEWLEWLINHLLSGWNLTVSGEVEWEGEDQNDRGVIFVQDNVIKTGHVKIVYPENPFKKGRGAR